MYKTLAEASAYLGKSDKTISRYIKRGILHPDKVKSQNGTLEYRFRTEELDTIRGRTDEPDKTRQDNASDSGFSSSESGQNGGQSGQNGGHKTRQTRQISIDFLCEQIERKDRQIEYLSREVNRHANQNIVLQNKLLGLPAPKAHDIADVSTAGTIDKRRIILLVCLAATIAIFVYVYRTPIMEIITYTKGVMTR